MKFIITLFVLVFYLFIPNNVYATTVTVGQPQTVIPTSSIPSIKPPWLVLANYHPIDAPLTTFVSGGIRYWFDSLGGYQAKFKGSLDQPFQTQMWIKSSETYFKDKNNLSVGGPWRQINTNNWTFDGSAPWIVNLYQVSDTELLAFLHVEQSAIVNGAYSTGRSSIALGWSTDAGEHFTYLGNIITYRDLSPDYNVQGAPYFIKDGYFYVYYHDMCPYHVTTVARAPVSEVIQAAKLSLTSPWKKYSLNWGESGIGGQCAGVTIPAGIDHTDAMYSTYTNKYYLLLSLGAYQPGQNSWINLYESADAINWTLVKTISQIPYQTGDIGYQYVSVVDASGSDNSIVGKSFYVYSGVNPVNAYVQRWLVTFDDIPPTPTPTQKPGDANNDNTVDGYDFGIWQLNYNKLLLGSSFGDFDNSTRVDGIDYLMWVQNYLK